MIPIEVIEAFNRLQIEGLVAITAPLSEQGSGEWSFEIELLIPQPNTEGLPPVVTAKVILFAGFPGTKANIRLSDPDLWRFPHMDLRDGHLCLKIGQQHQWDPWESLKQTIDEAQEWLIDAANRSLLKPGQPWELPDFRVKHQNSISKKEGGKPHDLATIWSLESPASFRCWSHRIGQYGDVFLQLHAREKGLVPIRFTRVGGEQIESPQPRSTFLSKSTLIRANWLILQSLLHSSHRPPRTFEELEQMCTIAGLHLWEILAKVGKSDTYKDRHFLLVGAPIPNTVGGPMAEFHWQPIALPKQWFGATKYDRGNTPKYMWLRDLLSKKALPWGETDNVSEERLRARGHLAKEVLGMKICVIGCGAVGSMVVDHLIRGGARDVVVLDSDVLNLDNLCRHVLGPFHVGANKAEAIAYEARGFRPDSEVRGINIALPLPPRPASEQVWSEIENTDVLIDCTSNQAVFEWLSEFGRENDRRVIHLFINPYARMMTICSSGRHASCLHTSLMLFENILCGDTPFTWEEYNPHVEEVPLGAGCWHPAFPARGDHLRAIVSSAISMIEALLKSPWRSHGRGVVLRRNDPDLDQSNSGVVPLVEVVWNRLYRRGHS